MPRLLSPIKFDASGSVLIRIYSRPVSILFHWGSNSEEKWPFLACPSQFDYTVGCSQCMKGGGTSERLVSIVWDLKKKKWCLFLAKREFYADIWKKSSAIGISQDDLATGNGMNVIVTMSGGDRICELIEPNNKDTPTTPCPNFSDMVPMFGKKSVFVV